MICPKCGSNISDDSKFCTFCGNELYKEDLKVDNESSNNTILHKVSKSFFILNILMYCVSLFLMAYTIVKNLLYFSKWFSLFYVFFISSLFSLTLLILGIICKKKKMKHSVVRIVFAIVFLVTNIRTGLTLLTFDISSNSNTEYINFSKKNNLMYSTDAYCDSLVINSEYIMTTVDLNDSSIKDDFYDYVTTSTYFTNTDFDDIPLISSFDYVAYYNTSTNNSTGETYATIVLYSSTKNIILIIYDVESDIEISNQGYNEYNI